MDNSEICHLIKNVYKPDKKYHFPKSNGRSFRHDWLDQHEWLCYSPSQNGAYCLSCVLFGNRFPGKASKVKKLFTEPLQDWKNAKCSFTQHAGKSKRREVGLHASTSPIFDALRSQISGTLQPIEMIMDAGNKKEIEQNREILSPIIDSVIFCGRLGLPLRGHRDDSKYHPTVGCYSSGGVGNFIETLNYGVRRGDKVLENHLKNCGKNRSYISKTSQNKIIKCCGQVISNQIISDIKKSKFFSVIADEASDSSHKEQCDSS
ncbi:52 kDa repressor of the inhibitor of the protein kinase-like isoform X1 [Xenia sp. Carnegie-2017]|uniref:52 kDa repressor of the inhibitor of the protein kinase-like isoform X1 n=1 Tax=Xenia sp. Carnegie-2017 TaxID=2897299 RepID=UPI001F04E392|nr:52 kDa repressor of the inhibitor of the protein kinase-like isoform X1 [Xenia sp. Carnegie-2017]XP_046864227.1 52 kDa repressor of the inhibitor of the protein kinase-like isoform X1 [Xenia sp. Carnegie-2017]